MKHENLAAKSAKSAKSAKGAKEELLFKEESDAIQGALFDVYREIGCGFLEVVYLE